MALLAFVPGCHDATSPSGGSSGPPPPAPTVSTADGGVDPVTREVRYLALGDSLTQGIGATDLDKGSFPALVSERWRKRGCKVELRNVGASGNTASQVISDQLPAIAEFKPTFITFQSGANDIANGVTMDAYRKDVKTVLEAAKGSGARVVVFLQNEWFRAPAGPGYGGTAEKRTAYDLIMLEEVKAKRAELLDLRLLYRQQADKNLWIDDGIHPTPESYEAWAAEIARVIPSPCGK
jgi:lysophospholipase L1-like esterase